jgi:hypothetical protein
MKEQRQGQELRDRHQLHLENMSIELRRGKFIKWHDDIINACNANSLFFLRGKNVEWANYLSLH